MSQAYKVFRSLKIFYLRHEELLWIIGTACSLGVAAICLSCKGNPPNAGICVSCFLENFAGALGFHDNDRMRYVRPELIGFVVGGLVAAHVFGEFKVTGGSSPLIRFFGGFFMIAGSAVFMGCPIRLFNRLANGDWSAWVGVPGLALGVWLGWWLLGQGVHLGASSSQKKINGYVLPIALVVVGAASLLDWSIPLKSQFGPGAQHAHLKWSSFAGLVIGFGAQRSRFCVTGFIGQSIVTRTVFPLLGPVLIFVAALLTSLYKGFFYPGFDAQPGSHTAYLWSFLGMGLVGLLSALLSGCPFRQITLASQGNTDSVVVFLGMLFGAAAAQSWGIASSNLGPTPIGIGFVLVGFSLTLLFALFLRIRD